MSGPLCLFGYIELSTYFVLTAAVDLMNKCKLTCCLTLSRNSCHQNNLKKWSVTHWRCFRIFFLIFVVNIFVIVILYREYSACKRRFLCWNQIVDFLYERLSHQGEKTRCQVLLTSFNVNYSYRYGTFLYTGKSFFCVNNRGCFIHTFTYFFQALEIISLTLYCWEEPCRTNTFNLFEECTT